MSFYDYTQWSGTDDSDDGSEQAYDNWGHPIKEWKKSGVFFDGYIEYSDDNTLKEGIFRCDKFHPSTLKENGVYKCDKCHTEFKQLARKEIFSEAWLNNEHDIFSSPYD